MSYDNTNRGAIWKNDDKQGDTHPDFKGSLNVNGTEFWVSAWKRKADANPKAPALSFSIKPKEEAPNNVYADSEHTDPSPHPDEPNDDIPF